jgi:hypothetical protein
MTCADRSSPSLEPASCDAYLWRSLFRSRCDAKKAPWTPKLTPASKSSGPTRNGGDNSRRTSTTSPASAAPSGPSRGRSKTRNAPAPILAFAVGAPVLLGDEIRVGHRLAELFRAARCGRRVRAYRSHVVHAPHGGPLRDLRRPSRSRVHGRTAPDRLALLHERDGADIYAHGRRRLTPSRHHSPAIATRPAATRIVSNDDA